MTSNHHAPYDLGYTRATMDGTKGCETARWSQSQKTIFSSDCRLQFAYMKPESLVDRKSTRLNSSHVAISYAVFCLKKKINRIDRRLAAAVYIPSPDHSPFRIHFQS